MEGFHSFETFNGIMESSVARVNFKRVIGNNSGVLPALFKIPVDFKNVVSSSSTKFQAVVKLGLFLFLLGKLDSEILSLIC